MKAHCCEQMTWHATYECHMHQDRAASPDVVVGYAARDDTYMLLIRDGEDGYAASGYVIKFCPWCGHQLGDG